MKLYKAGLQAKLARYKFKVSRVEFLGYVVRKEKISTDPKKNRQYKNGARQKWSKNCKHFSASLTSFRNLSKEWQKKVSH